ncbi:SET domain-containing protein 3 [Coemansia aciculifera]|uniref:SET domain-containing protein 3 n=1 Tax=Coemansia aciculifera TaxID=417176 RepID=A0A9W8IJD6_9FUNG|nr:SET domain-containing protein 3 [Coemansia aciculifera]
MLPATTAATRDNGGDSTPDEDQGVIRCICNIDDDDGFTIQCENCLVWQHAVCVNVDQDNVPDEYLCEKCNPRKLDVKRAVDYQKRRLESETKNVKDSRKRAKYVGGKVKRTDDANERRKRVPDSKAPRTKPLKPANSRESSSPASMPAGDRGRETPVISDNSYTTIERNILGADVQVLFQSVLSQLAAQSVAVSAAAAAAAMQVTTPPTDRANQPTGEELSSSRNPTTYADVATMSGSNDKTRGGSTLTSETNTHGPAPVAALKRESALPAMVGMADDEVLQVAAVYKGFASRDRGQIGLFAREPIATGRYICEYRGQVVLKAAYKEDPKNYYELLRTTRPHSHFYPDIDLCVDARRQGSEARFVRRSCEANMALKSIYVPGSADSLIHLGLFTTRGVQADEELTVGWEWDDGELPAVARMSASDAEDYLGRPEGRRMSKVWRQAFAGITCACGDLQCNVRRLFAMLGVEETVSRPDSGTVIKRRASRPHKIDTSGADGPDADLSSPTAQSLRSPDSARAALGIHSRKGSVADLGASPESPLANRGSSYNGGTNGDARSMLSVFSVQRASSSDCSAARKNSVDGTHGNVHQQQRAGGCEEGSSDDDDDSGGQHRPANGHSGSSLAMERVPSRNSSNHSAKSRSQSRKRKPSVHTSEVVGDKSVRPASPMFGVESGKRQRSTSGSPVPRNVSSPGCSLPLKKLWMSQYLEKVEVLGSSSGGSQSVLVSPVADLDVCANPKRANTMPSSSAESVCTKLERETEALASDHDVEMREEKREASEPLVIARQPPPLPNFEHTSEAAAPVLAAVKELSFEDDVAGDDQAVVKSLPTDADAPTPTPTDAATLLEAPLAGGASLDASSSGLAGEGLGRAQAEPLAAADERKADVAAAAAAPAAAAPKAAPVKKQRLSLEEYNKRRRGNAAAPASGETEAREGDGEGAATRPARDTDSSAGVVNGGSSTLTPLSMTASPSPTLSGKPSSGSAIVPASISATLPPRASRSPPPPPPPPPPPLHGGSERDARERAGSHELHRSREREYGRPGLHQPQPQRTDWRPANRGPPRQPGSPSAPSASRALSMSPGPYQHSAPPGTAPRRTGLGPGGSRGGSPSRK